MSDKSKSRKRFTMTLDEEVQSNFKIACAINKLDMNEVLEVLMKAYSDGILNLKELSEN